MVGASRSDASAKVQMVDLDSIEPIMNSADVRKRVLNYSGRTAWSCLLERPPFVWVSAERGSNHIPEPDSPFNAIFRRLASFEIHLPTLVEFSAVEQKVSPSQERVHIAAYDLKEIHQLTVKIVVDLNRARRFVK